MAKTHNSNMLYAKPSTSGYRSPGTQSYQNSPVSSRCNSPLPEEIQHFPLNLQNALVENRSDSPTSEHSINDQSNYLEKRYNLRQNRHKKNVTLPNNTQPKRKYNKRIKTHPYLNKLPDLL